MISVIIPLYNKEASIKNTLESVIQQSYQDFEIVIVNDGSTDKSLEEAQKVCDPRIRIFSQQNAGVSAARNRGIEEAQGEYVAFLDADDEWEKDYLSCISDLTIRYPEAKVFATKYNKSSDGVVKGTIIRNLPFNGQDGILSNYFEVASCSEPPLWTSAVVVNKDALLSIGGFPLGIKSGEDLLTWAILAVNHKIAYSTKELATFVLSPSEGKYIPKRSLVKKDVVGEALENLYRNNKGVVGFRKYLAFWHKIRSHVALGWGEHRCAAKEAMKAIMFNPYNVKHYVMLLMSALPTNAVRLILK